MAISIVGAILSLVVGAGRFSSNSFRWSVKARVVPLWPNLLEIPRILGAEVATVPLRFSLRGWSLDLDRLLDARRLPQQLHLLPDVSVHLRLHPSMGEAMAANAALVHPQHRDAARREHTRRPANVCRKGSGVASFERAGEKGEMVAGVLDTRRRGAGTGTRRRITLGHIVTYLALAAVDLIVERNAIGPDAHGGFLDWSRGSRSLP